MTYRPTPSPFFIEVLFLLASITLIGCSDPREEISTKATDSIGIELKEELGLANRKITAMTRLYKQVDSSKVITEKKLDEANTEIAALSKLIKRMNSSVTRSEKRLDKANMEIANLTKSMKEVDSSRVNTEKKLDEAKAEITDLSNKIHEIYSDIRIEKLWSESESAAYLTPGSEGFTRVRFGLGVMTVSIENVTPYANATKVTLRFGNVLSAMITGLSAKVEYGPVDGYGAARETETKTNVVRFSESLSRGAWTELDVVLDGIRSDQLGFVRLSDVTFQGVRLMEQ